MVELWDGAAEVYAAGGFVMPWLLATALVLWYGLAARWMALARGTRRPMPELLRAARAGTLVGGGLAREAARRAARALAGGQPWLRERLDAELWELRRELARHGRLVRTLAVLAPLGGLLGTVTGMIETFDSLAEMAMHSQGGGVAAGVSEALVSTQMGLVVAVPGLILGRLLDGRQRRLEGELEELVERACGEVA